jgi:hypothetical protein
MGIDNKKHIIDLKNLSPLIPLSLIKRGGDKERGAKPLLNTPIKDLYGNYSIYIR